MHLPQSATSVAISFSIHLDERSQSIRHIYSPLTILRIANTQYCAFVLLIGRPSSALHFQLSELRWNIPVSQSPFCRHPDPG